MHTLWVYESGPSSPVAQEYWSGRSKEDYKPQIEWESDGSNSAEWLAVLLRPSLKFKLLPSANGHMPKAKGAASKRAYAVACSTGPYAHARGDEVGPETVEVRD